MKNFFITIIFCLFFSYTAYAGFYFYNYHILFSYGLSDLEVSTKRGEGIVLLGGDLSELVFDNDVKKFNSQNGIWIYPGDRKMNDYDFWKITGKYKGKNFFIFGYTIETGGDTWFEKNSLTVDIIKLTFILGILTIISTIVIKKKIKNIS